jgi:hypothetical protein
MTVFSQCWSCPHIIMSLPHCQILCTDFSQVIAQKNMAHHRKAGLLLAMRVPGEISVGSTWKEWHDASTTMPVRSILSISLGAVSAMIRRSDRRR